MDYSQDLLHYILLIIGGVICGFINIMAGGGSFIVLPMLIGLGLPPTIANGTNRISLMMINSTGALAFGRKGMLPVKLCVLLALPTILGSLCGATIAAHSSDKILYYVIMTVLVGMLIYIYFKPPLKADEMPDLKYPEKVDILTYLLFFVIGIYGGFIQAGSALLWFAVLSWRLKLDLISADAIKLVLSFVMNSFSLIVFIMHKQVFYMDGVILGLGGIIGAILGTKIALKFSSKLVRIIMLIILGLAALYILFFKMLHLF